MHRAIVYPEHRDRAIVAGLAGRKVAARGSGIAEHRAEEGGDRRGPPSRSAATPEPDGYVDKLVKYIPGEVLVFYVTVSQHFKAHDTAILVMFVVGLVLMEIRWRTANLQVPEANRAPWWFYILAAAAYAAWVIGTSPATAAYFNISLDSAVFILTGAALAIPWVDDWLSAEFYPSNPAATPASKLRLDLRRRAHRDRRGA